MAEGILLNLYAPIYYENTWNMSSEQAADVAGVFPFWSDEVYEPLIPPGDIGEWYDPEKEKMEKRVKLIGAVAGECFAAEIDSGPYEPEDIRYDDQKVLDYKDGIYATQTFGHFIGVFSGDAFFGEVTSGPTDINDINHLQPDPQDYKDGIYATQTFGKFVGVFSDDVFSGEVASGVEPIDYTQQPETPYPEYKDPDWVVEEEEVVVTDELFIGLRTNEAYVADDVSAPVDVESINKNQPEPQKYKDGIYSTQTFGILCHAVSGEADAWSGIASGCKTADEEQVEQEYKDGIYSTQTFGKFVGVFSDDVFSFEVVSGVEPIPQGQKPETPYPNYKDPDWVVEEEVIVLLDEKFIGARSPEIYAGDNKSAPLKVEDINLNQKDEEPFIKGIYSTQTFGQYIGVASGDVSGDEAISGVLEYHQINNNQPNEQQYKKGVYATQTFGFISTEFFSGDYFSAE